jgi:uncharacterized protein (TIGR03382 family)
MNHLSSSPAVRACLALALAASASAHAAPTLLGDTLSFMRGYPSTTTQYGLAIPDTTVASGSSDEVAWEFAPGVRYALIDPEADSVSFRLGSGWIGTSTVFDGFVVSGFDHDIDSVFVQSNTTQLGVVLSQGLRDFTVSFSGNSGINVGSVVLGVTLRDTTLPQGTVPEPATAGLAALALAGLALGGRRRHG